MLHGVRGLSRRFPLRFALNQSTFHGQRVGLLVHNKPLAFRALSSLPDGVEELRMPALSPTMTVGSISEWLKKEGEEFAPGDVLCKIETDKAVIDFEMQDEAVLAKIVLPNGTSDVPVGATLALTVEDLDTYKELVKSGALQNIQLGGGKAASAASSASGSSTKAVSTPAPAQDGHRHPSIKFLGKRSLLSEAQLHALDLESNSPHKAGSKGATACATKSASAPAAASAAKPAASAVAGDQDANGAYEDLPLSTMRKVIAKRLTSSKIDVPHYYTSIDCEIDNILTLRKQLKNNHDVKVSMNDFLLKAVALALRDVPEANCYFDAKTRSIQKNAHADISVAVATPAGLITPIVPKCESIGLAGINAVFMELVGRARENKLKPEEFQGGSFTVSNLGGFGIDNFTAVINPPQACIMAVGRGRSEILPPKNVDVNSTEPQEPRRATLLNVTLSSDRRVVDDVIAGQFLQVFKRYMENPELLSL